VVGVSARSHSDFWLCIRFGVALGEIVLSSETNRDLSRGVFEVVVPKIENETVEYKQPLPVELLPFDQRNDKFIGVGTAFAISPTRFVTAAHVLPTYFALPTTTCRSSTGRRT